MRSYLSLVPISGRVHRRQNRMAILCIVFAVFLVTTIFSMAEMDVRMEAARLAEKHDGFAMKNILESGTGQTLLVSGVILFLLILTAGVLMISGSINSNVAQRTKFFGMMRCIGMSKRQIIHFVKLEALNWCKMAIPAGLILGTVTTWILCGLLRTIVGEEFVTIPLFGISIIGLASGIVMGVVTVLAAARTPAKRAARVSPVEAVSGNGDSKKGMRRSAKLGFFKVETALGIHHAVSARKNLILMTGSFALSIILFLSFSTFLDFVNYLLPQSYGDAQVEIYSSDNENSIDRELLDRVRGMEGVKRVFGRRSLFELPAELNGEAPASGTVDLVSFDDFDLECLKRDRRLKKGSNLAKVYGDSHYVLATWDKNSTWEIGDKVRVGEEEFEIAGLLKYDLFSSDGMTNGRITLISSEETFRRVTGVAEYMLVMVQTNRNATDENIEKIRELVGDQGTLEDKRDQQTIGTYTAFNLCVYAFLLIIMLVTVLSIVNSISMSVSARIKQYGAMRAVGMNEQQVTKMIAAEAFTYALSGCIVGCTVGLLLSRLLYAILIDGRFPYTVWEFPVLRLLLMVGFVILSVLASLYSPSKRMQGMSITETINEL